MKIFKRILVVTALVVIAFMISYLHIQGGQINA